MLCYPPISSTRNRKMASQFNYYQAGQQQQQTSAAVTGAMEWNGTAWVPAGGAVAAAAQQPPAAAAGEAPPQQPEVPPGHSLPPPNSTPQQFVAAYSAIYQEWKSQGSQQSQLAATLPAGPQKEEVASRAQWAEYYAQLSSRCAHYYNTLLSRVAAVQQQQQQQQQQQTYYHHQQQQQQQQQYGQYQGQHQQIRGGQVPAAAAPAYAPAPAAPAYAAAAAPSSAPAPPPEAMKRYVHRCLARCTTADQKKRVQAKVESVISGHIRSGTLHTTDWDMLECISVEEPQQHQYQQQYQQQQYGSSPPYKKQRSSGSDHYYGGGGSNTYGSGGGGGGGSSHYGPSSSFGQDQSDFIAFDSGSSPAKGKQRGGNKKKKGKQSKSKTSDAGYYAPKQDDGFERSDATLNARQARFSGQGGLSDTAKPSAIHNVERYMGKTVIGGTRKLNEEDFEAMTVKGTCTVLEKEYLRLTAPPRAELVRPEPILKEHLTNLKKLWLKPEKERGGGGKRDYVWFCSQFKALRQDLTVQRIFNAFAVHTYETHARIALEEEDLNEFNQCQTQLKELYEKLAHDQSGQSGLKNENEFIAYRILYYVILSGNKKYEGGSSDMMKIMLSLSSERRAVPTIAHALKVRVAFAEYDYHAFFALQDNCPNMGAYLMDYLVPSFRRDALQRIHKAFRPHIPADYVLSELGFDMTDDEDSKEGMAWLRSCGCKLSDDGKLFLTKDTVLKESDLTNTKSSLI